MGHKHLRFRCALASGDTSRPFPLKFRYLPNLEEESPLTGQDFLDLNIKVFADMTQRNAFCCYSLSTTQWRHGRSQIPAESSD
jgi:hypothetical protein